MAGPFSGTVAIRAMKDGDYQARIFAGTGTGLQAAIDYLAGGKGKVKVGPGTVEVSTVVSIHGGCHLEGCGPGVTVIKRATGSLTSGDAANSGNMILSTAYGSNGTANSSHTGGTPDASLDDISITDLTLDGNQSNFGAVNPSTPKQYGIRLFFTDGVQLRNLEIKELLETGIEISSCRNVTMSDIHIVNPGQYASPASRNGINVNNNATGSIGAGWARACVIQNVTIENPSDAHIDIANHTDVAISNCAFRGGGKYGFEFEGSMTGETTRGIAISNIACRDTTNNFVRFAPVSGMTYEGIKISNCHAVFSTSGHNAEALMLGKTDDWTLKDCRIEGCSFRNINSAANASAGPMVVLGLPGTTASSDIAIVDCSFHGGNGSGNNSANRGIDIYGNYDGITIRNVKLYDVEGRGVYIHPDSPNSVLRVLLENCLVDGCQSTGYDIAENSTAGTINYVTLVECIAKDTNKGASGRQFEVTGSVNSSTVKNVTLVRCRSIRSSGTNMATGLRVFQSGTATVDTISVEFCDFSEANSGAFSDSGSPTNVRFVDYPFKAQASISSGGTITLTRGGFHAISGVAAIDTITPYFRYDESVHAFVAISTCTFNDGTGNMKLAGNFVCTADDVISLRYDGVNQVWYEMGRSVN